MTGPEATELHGVLSRRYSDATVMVVPQDGGVQIVIENRAGTGRFSIGDGPSALLNYLVAGYAD
jgi:hypothetical protein